MLRTIAALTLVATIIWTGCGGSGEEKTAEILLEKAIEKESGKADVKISEGSMSVKTEDGEMIVSGGEGVKIPDGFPKDVHVYKEAKVIVSLLVEGNFQVTLQSKDAPSKIVETYKEKMKADDWVLDTQMAMETGDMLHYKKDERRVMITVAEDDGNAMISLNVQEKK